MSDDCGSCENCGCNLTSDEINGLCEQCEYVEDASTGRRSNRYRILGAGEVIQAGDESDSSVNPLVDSARWVPVNPKNIGKPAPDPAYPAHTIYRRLVK